MSRVKDPAIKLFGKTIQLLPADYDGGSAPATTTTISIAANDHHHYHEQDSSTSQDTKKSSVQELTETIHENTSSQSIAEELIDPATSLRINEDPKTPVVDKETPSAKTPEKEDIGEIDTSEEKTLKKPDKILPCPRCKSMDTKFCYYNNYNVNQPRHFCKKCQRYWTAGGTMRNVPVGSGRRKNKCSSASHYRDIMVSEALRAARADAANCAQNGFHGHEQRIPVSCEGKENGDDYKSESSRPTSNSSQKGESVKSLHGFPPPAFVPSGFPPPAFVPSGFPIPFYPVVPPFWGCTVPNPWNMPWLSHTSSSSDSSSFSTMPNSPTLGKHSRDGNILEKKESRRRIWIPKTLRIDDPSEAAKSSIWSTLGIKNNNSDSINAGSLLNAFQPKSDDKNYIDEMSLVLKANPAALSRSRNFQENA